MESVPSDQATPDRLSPRRGPLPVKVVIAGGFGVGKTTMVGAISDIAPLTTEGAMTTLAESIDDRSKVAAKTSTTVAMDFGRVAIDNKIVMYLFGTPGQDRFGFMWDDLIVGSLGAIVLLDSRRIDEAFPALDYFENRGVPFVVAVNRFDSTVGYEIDEVRESLNIGTHIPIIEIDARQRDGVKEALLALMGVVLDHALERAGK
jgi:uncharacterized protein